MEHSVSAANMLIEFYEGLSNRDETTIDRVFSTVTSRMIGTEPHEWFGPEIASVREAYRKYLTDSPMDYVVVPGRIESHQQGSIAWVADQPTFRLADGVEVPLRISGVLRMEAGSWKFVNIHLSAAVSDESTVAEAIGNPS